MSAELVLRNGGFTTLDRSNPSATVVGITAGVFTAVGRDSDVMQSADPDTRIIDLAGQIGHRCAPSAAMRHGATRAVRGSLRFTVSSRRLVSARARAAFTATIMRSPCRVGCRSPI